MELVKPSFNLLLFVDIIGYAASAIILVSFLMKNMRTLRIINSVGCALFIIYGVLLFSIPVIITNFAIVIINIFYLLKTEKK